MNATFTFPLQVRVNGWTHPQLYINPFLLNASTSLESLLASNSHFYYLTSKAQCKLLFSLVLLFVEMGNNQCLPYNDPSDMLDLYSLS